MPCTSKTLAEVTPLRADLGLAGPVVVENGASIHGLAPGSRPAGAALAGDGSWELVLGPDHATVLAALGRLGGRLGRRLRGLSELDEEEARRVTGLDRSRLRAARERRHSEPFLAPETPLEELRDALDDDGLEVTAGGRFFHLGGRTSKGDAARRLVDGWRRRGWNGATLALGDSLNDRSLLEGADRAVLVPKPRVGHDAALLGLRPDLCLAHAPGPVGWNAAVLAWLDFLEHHDP